MWVFTWSWRLIVAITEECLISKSPSRVQLSVQITFVRSGTDEGEDPANNQHSNYSQKILCGVEVRVLYSPLKFLHNQLVRPMTLWTWIYAQGHGHTGGQNGLPKTVVTRKKAYNYLSFVCYRMNYTIGQFGVLTFGCIVYLVIRMANVGRFILIGNTEVGSCRLLSKPS